MAVGDLQSTAGAGLMAGPAGAGYEFVSGQVANMKYPGFQAPDTSGIQQQVHEMGQRAMATTPESVVAERMQGTEQAKNLLPPAMQQGQASTALGGGGAPQSAVEAALNQKAQGQYEGTIQRLGRQAELEAPQVQAQRLQAAGQAALQMNRYNQQVAMAQYKSALAKRQAQSAVVGSILGLAGSLGGAAAGGSGGASAGGQMGQGLGGMM